MCHKLPNMVCRAVGTLCRQPFLCVEATQPTRFQATFVGGTIS